MKSKIIQKHISLIFSDSNSLIQVRASVKLTQPNHELPVYECDSDPIDSSHYMFQDLSLNETHPYFEPFCQNSMIKVSLSGTVHTLTSDICDTFSNIRSYTATNMKIEMLQIDTFYKCSKLTKIDLSRNNLTSLPADLFSNNEFLATLILDHNHFETIECMTFQYNSPLQKLSLIGNELSQFPLIDYYGCNLYDLEILCVDAKTVREINTERVMEIMPKLNQLWFEENDLSEAQFAELKTSFKQHGVRILINEV